jgi:hypothetical protein
MPVQVLPCCAAILALALALPSTVSAAPTTVTSATRGTAVPYYLTLHNLGWDYTNDPGNPVPYELSISAVFDPDDPTNSVWQGDMSQYRSDITVSFRLGTDLFTYSGPGVARLLYGSGPYAMSVEYPNSALTEFTHWFAAPNGALTGDPLLPRELDSADGLTSRLDITTWPSNPDAPGRWSMSGTPSFTSLTVISAVPEPASAISLVLGLLPIAANLGWKRRRAVNPQ